MNDVERRLAAIIFTDIVGYSALTGRDEMLAMELLREHHELLRPVFVRHGGIEVKTIGDSFMVEFPSVVNAVSSAIEMQQTLADRNSAESPQRQLVVRIGIHVGDVILRENDVFGDGVNIASRIEPLAQPGGISAGRHLRLGRRGATDSQQDRLPGHRARLGAAQEHRATDEGLCHPVAVAEAAGVWRRREVFAGRQGSTVAVGVGILDEVGCRSGGAPDRRGRCAGADRARLRPIGGRPCRCDVIGPGGERAGWLGRACR